MSDENVKDNKQGIDFACDAEVAEGVYSNYALVSHSISEFVLDFAKVMPGMPKGKIKSRIILTPDHAKRVLAALKDNIARYEAVFGEIKERRDNPQERVVKTTGMA